MLDVGCGTGSVSRIIADTREAKIIAIKPDLCRAAAVGDPLYWRGARIRHGRPRRDCRFRGPVISADFRDCLRSRAFFILRLMR